ncbi:MAG TPA: cupin domain-containing protein [Gemmatimonadales bacterium]|nr:cupin domain-containing protein [Gemmatimonadales bacterium]
MAEHPTGADARPPYQVVKPWGYELVWARTDRYVGKILHIEAGQVLSLQYHTRKDETIHVLRGEILLRIQLGEELTERRMREGESYHITPPTIHQMEAVTTADLLEVSTPEVEDVIRLQDKYGRA